LAWFFRIAPGIPRLHLSVPSCQQSLTSAYGSIGAQSVAVGKVPGLMDIHGGGQTASRGNVEQMGANGYACISINPGAHPLPELKPDDPNTDWGAVDATQTRHLGSFFHQQSPIELTLLIGKYIPFYHFHEKRTRTGQGYISTARVAA
jgi:hypothetical protein